jgi:hypothetical protein
LYSFILLEVCPTKPRIGKYRWLGITANEQGLALLGNLKNVRPEPLLIEKQMYKITYKCPPMFVLSEQLPPCCCR